TEARKISNAKEQQSSTRNAAIQRSRPRPHPAQFSDLWIAVAVAPDAAEPRRFGPCTGCADSRRHRPPLVLAIPDLRLPAPSGRSAEPPAFHAGDLLHRFRGTGSYRITSFRGDVSDFHRGSWYSRLPAFVHRIRPGRSNGFRAGRYRHSAGVLSALSRLADLRVSCPHPHSDKIRCHLHGRDRRGLLLTLAFAL